MEKTIDALTSHPGGHGGAEELEGLDVGYTIAPQLDALVASIVRDLYRVMSVMVIHEKHIVIHGWSDLADRDEPEEVTISVSL